MKPDLAQSPTQINQLIDYYLTEEIILGCHDGYSRRISGHLLEHNVKVSGNVIYTRARKVLAGRTVLHPLGDVDGHPAHREGKDQNYAGFWALVDIAHPDMHLRSYIGLSANQIDVVRHHVNSMVVCEYYKERAIKLKKLTDALTHLQGTEATMIQIIEGNIFDVMKSKKESFNIFDLDLMCHMPDSNEVLKWAKQIYSSAIPGKNVIGITTGVGRNITVQDYNQRAEALRGALVTAGFQEIGHSRFSYRDRRIPMRSERYILTK